MASNKATNVPACFAQMLPGAIVSTPAGDRRIVRVGEPWQLSSYFTAAGAPARSAAELMAPDTKEVGTVWYNRFDVTAVLDREPRRSEVHDMYLLAPDNIESKFFEKECELMTICPDGARTVKFDVCHVHVTQPAPAHEPTPGAEKLTKGELACYVVAAGPTSGLTRAAILQAVSALQGKPYVPSSNGSYFKAKRCDGTSWIDQGLLIPLGKQGREILYHLGANGPAAATRAALDLDRRRA